MAKWRSQHKLKHKLIQKRNLPVKTKVKSGVVPLILVKKKKTNNLKSSTKNMKLKTIGPDSVMIKMKRKKIRSQMMVISVSLILAHTKMKPIKLSLRPQEKLNKM